MKIIYTIVEPKIANNYKQINAYTFMYDSNVVTNLSEVESIELNLEEQKIIPTTEIIRKETKENNKKTKKSRRDSNKQSNDFEDTC